MELVFKVRKFIREVSYVVLTLAGVLACTSAGAAPEPSATDRCPLGPAVPSPDGSRRLALIVGVGAYQKASIPKLTGPPNDARHFYELLTGPNGYGFPKENVCLLLDDEATTQRFRDTFAQALVKRVSGKKDVAVVFFAGHGSETPDRNGDEPSDSDQTLLFADARTGEVGDLVDDEFNSLLAGLAQQTPNIVVVLDSCSSASATRGDASTFTARFVPPAPAPRLAAQAPSKGDGGKGWTPTNIPGLISFTAASDGTAALESNGAGIFTDALIQVLSATPARPLFYGQAARQMKPLIAAHSYQIPYFEGDLDRPVFDNTSRSRPAGWDVEAVDPVLTLKGPPLPGFGKGAELRIYAGNVSGGDTRDPAKAKAVAVIDDMPTALQAQAHVLAKPSDARAIAVGDLAVLARPANDYLTLKVRLRPSGEVGGLRDDEAAAVRAAIAADEEARLLVEPTTSAGDFELSLADANTFALRGGENRVRMTWARTVAPPVIAENLWKHARQRALLQLQGEGGSDFSDNETLQVVVKPDADQDACAHGTWIQAPPNQEQVIPLCHKWKVEVTVDRRSPYPLLVGGLALSTDGEIYPLSTDLRTPKVEPGQTLTIDSRFRGRPPLDTQDQLIVFGTREENAVPWHRLTQNRSARSAGIERMSSLYRTLNMYLGTKARGLEPAMTVEPSSWTLTVLPIRVEANSRFLQPADPAKPQTREYTLASFDVRPYLPDATSSALYKVLVQADALARLSVRDGVPYKQHAWAKGSDAANLQEGIDCSRAIWYAFTRAGLPYNETNRYLSTAEMVGNRSAMAREFASCGESEPILGDVLVYRDAAQQAGHVVMVIDPDKRIAWGSHGWDGNVNAGLPADTGVEYQLIKYKPDWQRWDRPGMERTACWRYGKFAAEALRAEGQPGTRAVQFACDAKRQCGRLP